MQDNDCKIVTLEDSNDLKTTEYKCLSSYSFQIFYSTAGRHFCQVFLTSRNMTDSQFYTQLCCSTSFYNPQRNRSAVWQIPTSEETQHKSTFTKWAIFTVARTATKGTSLWKSSCVYQCFTTCHASVDLIKKKKRTGNSEIVHTSMRTDCTGSTAVCSETPTVTEFCYNLCDC